MIMMTTKAATNVAKVFGYYGMLVQARVKKSSELLLFVVVVAHL